MEMTSQPAGSELAVVVSTVIAGAIGVGFTLGALLIAGGVLLSAF